MAPKKGGLSAALSGTGPTEAPSPPPMKKINFDPTAFPCLTFAEEVDAGLGETGAVNAEFDPIFEVVGSAPTNTILNGAALVRAPWGLAAHRGSNLPPHGLSPSLPHHRAGGLSAVTDEPKEWQGIDPEVLSARESLPRARSSPPHGIT